MRNWAHFREWVREAQRRQSSEWQARGLQELDSRVSNSDKAGEGQALDGSRSHGGAAGPGPCMRHPPPPLRVLKDSGAGSATSKCP